MATGQDQSAPSDKTHSLGMVMMIVGVMKMMMMAHFHHGGNMPDSHDDDDHHHYCTKAHHLPSEAFRQFGQQGYSKEQTPTRSRVYRRIHTDGCVFLYYSDIYK